MIRSKNFRTLAAAALLVLTCACATVTDVVPDEQILHVSDNVYEILNVDYRGIFGGEASLIESVTSQADKFAKSRGKVASPLSARVHRVGILADWAWFYYKFALVDPGTPESYRNMTDIQIVRDARLAPEFYAQRNQAQSDEQPQDVVSQIRALDQLRKDGLITDAEFEAQKKRVLESQR